MGHNHAIKAFDPRTPGHTLDLFTSLDTRGPVLAELARSPWFVRAAELASPGSGLAGKRRERAIDVIWDEERGVPQAFLCDGRRYPVELVVQTWAVERAWWDPRRRVSRHYLRVLTGAGLYDLAYDHTSARWLLVGVVD